MLHFEFSSLIPAPPTVVFAFHEQPDAFERLTPPWQKVRMLRKTGGLRAGAVVEFLILAGPLQIRWVAHHIGYAKNEYFIDEQKQGPFAQWVHTHRFQRESASTRLVDSIDYALKGGPTLERLGGWFVERQLRRMFAYRHEVTRRACTATGP